MADDDIQRHRAGIDALDLELVRLLNERAAHARAIGTLKSGTVKSGTVKSGTPKIGDQQSGGPIYRPEREAEVLANAARANAGPIGTDALKRVFIEVMSACRALEQTTRVAYLGPAGTFSEMAVTQQFGHSIDADPCPTIDAAFRACESDAAHYAVVPVENSTEGAVGRTLDLLMQTPLQICAEVVVRVHQNLMAQSVDRSLIKKVYSHQQSLAQTHGWLAHHLPHAERVAVTSNAEAARLASVEEGTAAIGPAIAAERYALELLAANIEDDPRNRTRFLVLGKQTTVPTGNDRTSLVLSTHNRPGAVHTLLTPLRDAGVSMSRIESRPARTGQWEYFFYLDLVGHRDDPAVARALTGLQADAAFIKIFGSYPAAAI